MNTHVINKAEKSAIDAIFEEAERSLVNDYNPREELQKIDEQCRNIWSDWDTSIPPHTPLSPKMSPMIDSGSYRKRKVISPPHQVLKDLCEDISNLSSNFNSHDSDFGSYENSFANNITPAETDDYSDYKKTDELHSNENDTFNIDYETSNLLDSPKRIHKRKRDQKPFSSTKKKTHSTLNNYPRTTKSNPSSTLFCPIYNPPKRRNNDSDAGQLYNRYDMAKLRQENIDLQKQVTKLQAALEKANQENFKLKQSLNQAEIIQKKQKTMIEALKQSKHPKRT